MSETKTFTKKTELVFTTIEISKTAGFGLLYEATFKYGKSEKELHNFKAVEPSVKSLLNRISRFLDCEIDERHYIIK